MKRAMAVALGGLLLTTGAMGNSLRERIEARRRAARSRGAPDLQERLEAARPFDPETDPWCWPVKDYDVPGRQSFGSYDKGGYEGRVYAEAPREIGEELEPGTPVFLYEVNRRGEDFRLLGRGVIRKTRPKRNVVSVEAALLACTQCIRETNKMTQAAWVAEGLVDGPAPSFRENVALVVSSTSMMKDVSVVKFRGRAHPKVRRYFMSTRALGPYGSWSQEQVWMFLRGQAWKGMSGEALVAMMGVPHMGRVDGDAEIYQWGTGSTLKQFTVRNDAVEDVSLGAY